MLIPNDIPSSESVIDESTDDIISMIDKQIAENHFWYNMYDFAFLEKEYPKEFRDKIADTYRTVGWPYVDHRTSSELGNNQGLTEFRFSKYPIEW